MAEPKKSGIEGKGEQEGLYPLSFLSISLFSSFKGVGALAFTYDLDTDRGVVRLYIGDTDEDNPIFTDAEIDVFVAKGTNVDVSAARALMTIASSKARLAIAKKAGNYSEDLKSLAKELREQAAWFVTRSKEEGVYDDYLEMDLDGIGGFSYEERIENEALRK